MARRYWTAAIAALVSTIVLSVAPLAIYGAGFTDLVETFWRIGNSGWPIRGNNQSLIAALDRLTLGLVQTPVNAAGVREAADAPMALALFAALAPVLVGTFVVMIAKTPRRPSSILGEMAMATVLAILLSPIAWDHYWTMMLPAFLVDLRGRAGTAARVRRALRLLVGGDPNDGSVTDDAWRRRLQPRARALGVHWRRADSVCHARRDPWKKKRAARLEPRITRTIRIGFGDSLQCEIATENTDDTDK